MGNRHGEGEACWDLGLIKCNPVPPSFTAETHKPKSPKSLKFAAIFIYLITVSGSLYLWAWELFTALSHLCARCQRIIKTPGEGWVVGGRPRSLGPMTVLLALFYITTKACKQLKTEGTTGWQSTEACGTWDEI